ncbi:uncharacterized protein LOC129173539 isoform X2 [Dunckerocampus dactyliophorus]|uniref:uncharacterized protein LOC129173539 isoform X2 n=1 Tax=Dunckerocampus dactyliophorus TaxID=161453 RepID=UPI002405C972|nr:uncharacterized protein LOC129173539 isoform X2 [Dunckerocampus dactyliophorus]
MDVLVHVVVSLLLAQKVEGSGVMTTFVQQGKDNLFKVEDNITFTKVYDQLVWKFNKNYTIVRLMAEQQQKIFPNYETRVSVVQRFSLLINNVQASDSGFYTALLLGSPDLNVAEYHLRVQDAVSPVELVVVSVSTRNDLCNLTVMCTTDSVRVNSTFRCDQDNCSEVDRRHSGAATPALYLQAFFSNVSIVCNHSNKVSWTMDAKEVRDICVQSGEPDKTSIANWIWISVLAALGLGLLGLLGLLYKWITYRNRVMDRTDNQHTDLSESNHAILNTNNLNDASNLSPNTTYALVEFHTGPREQRITGKTSPETMYAQVMRAKPKMDTGHGIQVSLDNKTLNL